MSIKYPRDVAGFVQGWEDIGKIFGVSKRSVRRWSSTSKLRLLEYKCHVVLPAEHIYYFWVRVCRYHRNQNQALAMASAGQAMFRFLKKNNVKIL